MSRLLDEIKKYQDKFKNKVPVDIQETMLSATKKLGELGLSKNALKRGAKFENFEFSDIEGKDVKLYDYLNESDFLVINFYRGAWCPYCNLELKALQNSLSELNSLNARLIAVSPQSPDNSLSTKEKNELQFDVLSDFENKVAKKVGLVFSLADELKPIYKSFGIDIPTSNNEDSYELPMPATYVINKNKEIIFSFIHEDYTKRSEPKDIIDAIKEHLLKSVE